MSRKKEILTAAGTLAFAIGIGFVMQNSIEAEHVYGKAAADAVAPVIDDTPESEDTDVDNAMLTVEAITLTSGEFDSLIDRPAQDSQVITASAPQSILPEPAKPEAPTGIATPGCNVTAEARAIAAAMVELTMSASCLPNERVTVHHNGMIFTETTSANGLLSIKVPALASEAVFIVAFTNGEGAVAQTKVQDLADFDRVVLQWKGNTGFQIHAREFGAAYGTTGHVWEGAPGDMAAAVTGAGGVLTRNGDRNAADPLLAEVYTFPKKAAVQSGDITLSVETEINRANCGVEIEAQTLEIAEGGKVRTQNLTLPVPECDSVGSFLVLNNLLQNLKVAQK